MAAEFPCTQPISPPTGQQIYTDGSLITTKDGTLAGAGIHNATTNQNLRINPGGQGCTLTNNRAELCAIMVALETASAVDLTIYTDSLGSLQNIQKRIDFPKRLSESKHLAVIDKIVTLLGTRAAAGLHTYLYKVRSHTGVAGNDAADLLAKEAALAAGAVDHTTNIGETAYAGMHWPIVKKHGTGATMLAPSLTQGIKNNLPKTTQRGPTRKTGVYTNIWDAQLPTIDGAASSKFWTSSTLTWPQKLTLLKARWGHLWSKKLAYRYRLNYAGSPATTDKCPICKCHTDGASHILAGCLNSEMKGAYIKRHDQAVKIVQRSITKGGLGGTYMIMDAGKLEDLPDSVQRKTLPDELRPSEIPSEQWGKMRPDILIIPGLMANEQQHAELIVALRAAGHIVTSHVITLGTTGTILTSLKATLTDLQIDKQTQEKATSKLHLNATTCAGNIIAMRRHMEWQPGDLG
jgi:ribonuclease HI